VVQFSDVKIFRWRFIKW